MSARPESRRSVREVVREIPGVLALYSALKRVRAQEVSPYRNLYHACTQKTASQFFRRIFTSAPIFDHTGLRVVPYTGLEDARGIGMKYARITEPFPRNSIVAHLYIDRPTFDAIPKPGRYKAFYVMRDPRDVVVSWYFHVINPKTPNKGAVSVLRERVRGQDFETDMRTVMDEVEAWGTFDAARTWQEAEPDPRVVVYRYEDLVEDNHQFLATLFAHLDIEMSEPALAALVDRFSFEQLTGRQRGEEDVTAHMRKGISGDWVNHFTPQLAEYFQNVTDDAAVTLGYAW